MEKLNREIRHKDALKHEGHDLIDELVGMGINRRQVYITLAARLGRPEIDVHFERVRTIRELAPMVQELRAFRDERLRARPYKLKKKQRKGKPTAPQKPEPIERKPHRFVNESLPREIALPLIREVSQINAKRVKHPLISRYLPFLLPYL